jgi:FG-GAP repeat
MVFTTRSRSMALLVVFLTMSTGIASAAAASAAAGKGPFEGFRLTPGDLATGSQFGRSVAIDGDLVAVGMGGDDAVGAVYLYRRQGLAYIPEAKLVAPDASDGAEFGRAVAIQANRVMVGARFAQVGALLHAGAVYEFRKYGNSWHFEEKVVSPAPEDYDNFGRALAIQGDTLVVTARKSSLEEGTAYTFGYGGGTWIPRATLTAGDSAPGAYFGQSVAIQGDALVIGARNANPNGAGAFYLFRRSGETWVERAKVTPTDGRVDDQYGFTVAFEGDTIAVGARRADLTSQITNTGAVYVYSLEGDSIEPATILTADDAAKGDEFGQSVALAGDVLAVGAWKDDARKGSIYLFRRTGGMWTRAGKVMAPDGIAGDEFGYSLAAFGNRMVTGAHTADFISPDGGAAYVLPLKPQGPEVH